MTHRRPDLHRLGHATIYDLRLHRSSRIELSPIPLRNAARRPLDAATKTALVCSVLLLERVVSVALHPLDGLDVNSALRLFDQLFPARLSGQRRTLAIVKVKVGFHSGQLRIYWKVRADEITVLRAAHAVFFQSQLK